VGSSNTYTYFVNPDPHPKDYREPEVVPTQDDDTDSIPALTTPNEYGQWTAEDWSRSSETTSWTNNNATQGWDNNYGGGYYAEQRSAVNVPITGRQEYEEKNWWDPDIRIINKRPGPGLLPPILLEELHNSEHSLFSISVTNPDIHPLRQSSERPNGPSPTPSASSAALYNAPPTEDEVRTAVPHPNAYYCPSENGWVILSWKSSSMPPPFALSFEISDHAPLPNQAWRKQTNSCIGDDGVQFNKTHHFHKYPKAIDALKLTPALRVDDWEAETATARRRLATHEARVKEAASEPENSQPEAEEGKLLDLYVCCQCSFYCVASDLIPGVIPWKCLDRFIKDKRSNPPPGKSGEHAVVIAMETIMLYVERTLPS
jgi:ubiquitin carboxyl-terminal hydrolase 25/28